MKMMKIHGAIPLLLAAFIVGCGEAQTQDAPPLVTMPTQPEKKSWLDQTGDAAGAAWNSVATPISGLIPKAKAKPQAKPAEAETAIDQPPEIIVITRENRGVVTQEPKK